VPSWDEDSAELRRNLSKVLDEIVLAAQRRKYPTVASAKRWHSLLMKNLTVPDARFVGAFRGEPGLEKIQVRVGIHYGTEAAEVCEELAGFESKLHALLRELDTMLPSGQEPDADQLAAVVDLCAWAHAEWVRIHPFANGNGRTARLWANCVARRYGLPPFICLRPRPNYSYGEAGAKAMHGDWRPTAAVFRRLLDAFLDES
jgi:fido (protein-threonine AMPylation protein)